MSEMYREVPLIQQAIVGGNESKSLSISSGGYNAMLMDSKTPEIAGGFRLNHIVNGVTLLNRFIYWRTCRETILFSEICLDRNDIYFEMKITFEGSPVLAIQCCKTSNSPLIMIIVTTAFVHRISVEMPASMDHQKRFLHDSIISHLNENNMLDPLNCYNFTNDIGQVVPVAATVTNTSNNMQCQIAIACTNSLHLLALRIEGDKIEANCSELDHNPLTISKLIHSIADSWRGKSDSSQVVTLSFDQGMSENQTFLYTLHRNGTLRVWLLSGRCLASEYLSKYTQSSETEFHTSILRCSQSLLALYFSFQTFSEFIVIRPEVSYDSSTGAISSVVLKTQCTILAPNNDLIDFKLSDERLWTLWCNAEGETQALFYELNVEGNENIHNVWSPVILENISDKEHQPLEAGINLKDVYCNRIFQSGIFSDTVIRKSLLMFNRNIASVTTNSSGMYSSMLRLKRYAITCMENQLQLECVSLRQNGPLDEDQIQEISNGLWEKFYLYCMQYRFESSRPIGLFICEKEQKNTSFFNAGIIREKYVSFFRICDGVEVAFFAPIIYDRLWPIENVLKDEHEMMLLVTFLSEVEQALTMDQKDKLDSFIHQRQGWENNDNNLSLIGAAQHQLLVLKLLPGFLQRISNLPKAIEKFLEYLQPVNKEQYISECQTKSLGCTVYGSNELSNEIALSTAKQTIQLRYILLRNLLLVQHVMERHSHFHYHIIDAIQSKIRPDTENTLRCYHVMNWIAHRQLDIDWTKCNNIQTSFSFNARTSVTLLQAYAVSQLSNEILFRTNAVSSLHTINLLTLRQKTNLIIAYICPSSDDFLFGEWLSKNELHVHIDEYVRLLCNWCQWNSCSRNFIKAKSCLAIGDTFKALDLFPLSWKGIHNERMLKKILSQDEKLPVITPYASLSAFHLKLIRLFRKYGAHDGVLKLVHSGIDNTLQPVQQTMFQSIEFSCHVDLGHYEEAYNTLIKNCEPARKKDCLRQLVCLLFAVRRLDILLDLPYYGLEEEFTSIVGMSARSADISDCIQYDFLYSFYMNKKNLRRSAIISYEECMRNCFECSSLNHLNRYFNCIMKCLNSLSVTKESYAWIDCPIIDKIEASHIAQDDKIEIVDAKRLEEQLITVHCALLLSTKNDGCKLVTSLDATNLISLMLKQKLYRSAMKLARCRARSMVPTIYEHLTSSCIEASSSANFTASTIDAIEDYAGIPWLNDNGVSDVLSVSHSVTSVWNYLRYTLDQEEDTLVIDAYLAVLNRILSRCAYIPSWLKNWCFENIPIQFIRAYLRHGRLEEAYEYTIELFRTIFFSAGRFNQHTIFPLTMCEYLLYELDNSSIHDKKKHLECYLRIIEVAL
ncbi:nuclear pore complex protein Nup160 homolog isoform X2 [Anopheles gambiae]|uniref:nuclear pore complex protein Nup160 homolog isoform X2 n=1 Tax=Anopheles gambiae TaxID=7165 RepID=UPI002AC9241C|nr:nuclear pore complex protein Nup160 homolog isoform X2 [Anopheles gambiae]